MALTPKDWFNQIDLQANKALKNNWSRFSLEWGTWSAAMNRRIRKRIEGKDPEAPKLQLIFLYWVLWSQAIEFAYKKSNGEKINEDRFHAVVDGIEYIKQSIEADLWSQPDIQKTADLSGVVLL
jgi:hypothetical protein